MFLIVLAVLLATAHAVEDPEPRGRAGPQALRWAFSLPHQAVARIELLTEDGTRLTRLFATDGRQRSLSSWCRDRAPEPGRVEGELRDLYLAPGRYRVREVLGRATVVRALEVADAPGRRVRVSLPEDTRGVVAWPADAPEDTGFAYAPRRADGTASLSVGPGRWCASVLGAASVTRELIEPATTDLSFHPRRGAPKRRQDTSQRWMVRYLLFPVSLFILFFGLSWLWRSRRIPGFGEALLVSAGLGLLAIQPAIEASGSVVLTAGDTPIHSMTWLAAVADGLPELSDVSTRFSYPEGATWLMGTSWLGYLLVSPLTLLTDPVTAHHLGSALCVALLALAGWCVARRLGMGRVPALLVLGCLAFSPQVFRIIDTLRLDYLTLFLVPPFFLCLHKSMEEDGWRWPAAAGVFLAAVFYGQVYYGLYLASACPLLAVPRLLGRDAARRLMRLGVCAAVAAALLIPGLITLQESTRYTRYGQMEGRLLDRGLELWAPLDRNEASRYVRENWNTRVPPMGTPEERLMAAASRSYPVDRVLAPTNLLPGHALYWPLVLLSLLLARPARRRLAVIATLDVVILLVYSMGPFARVGTEVTGVPLPYYFNFLFIPSFEKLRAVQHFGHLAVAISAFPLALGLDGLLHRSLQARARALLPLRVAAVALAVLFLNAYPTGGTRWPDFQWPRAVRIPTREVIRGLSGAPVLALPYTSPTGPRISIDALRYDLSLVNPLSIGERTRQVQPDWIETNGILNHLAWTSGTVLQGCLLGLGDPSGDLADLRRSGLRAILLYRSLLPEPWMIRETEELLDGLFLRIGDDGDVVAWDVGSGPDEDAGSL